ncbi:hypothetical protein [Methylophilus sp. 13]|uniref:hypothetical protein n=1 Tax=Methylophilus sp. 13 TaxID=2781018 RepID=UPI001E52CBC2|nr:hypothetical protein [Methylophilus sp. 13]
MAVLNSRRNGSEALSRVWARLQFAWQHSPWRQPWLLGLLVLTLAVAIMLAQAWWLQQDWQQRLRAPAAGHSPQTQTARPTTSSANQALPQPMLVLAQWPSEEDADRVSAEILALADAMGMVFERAEFQSGATAQSDLYVQRIKLPLSGDYVQLRHFLALVLQRYPSLALAQFKLQRTDVQQAGLEAYIEFNLYTRKRRPA